MAKVTFGPGGVRRYSGAVCNAFYRKRGSETILAKRPKRSNRKPSEAHRAHRQRFGRAIIYGRRVMRDLSRRAVNEETTRRSGQATFRLAVQDYFLGPEVEEIDLSAYNAALGAGVTVLGTDDIEVRPGGRHGERCRRRPHRRRGGLDGD